MAILIIQNLQVCPTFSYLEIFDWSNFYRLCTLWSGAMCVFLNYHMIKLKTRSPESLVCCNCYQGTIHILHHHIFGIFGPPSPLRQHVFSTKNKQKLAFSDPPPPLQVLT